MPGRRRPAHLGHHVHEQRIGALGEQIGHLDAPVAAHAAEVVALEVDDHHVLGALLGVGGESGRSPCRRAAACP